jgi:hypothetical protein
MLAVPADLIIYLVLVQTVPLLVLKSGILKRDNLQYAIALQVLLFLAFWLVWGGYSVDAWRYLSRFDRDPLRFEEEQLFWLIGHGLGKVFVDPWPLKILSALAAALFAYATVSLLRRHKDQLAYYGLFLIPLMPAFFLAFGNAIRQGLAASIVMLGVLALQRKQIIVFVGLGLAAFFFHQTSLALVLAALLGTYQTFRMPIFLALAPLTSFVAHGAASLYGVDLAEYVRYADYQEGAFHWAKFFVAYGFAWILWWTRPADDIEIGKLTATYGYMVALSSLLLHYEVPFERLLLYSELLLPTLLALWLFRRTAVVRRVALLWCIGIAMGLALWTHPSIVTTLGY